MQILEVKDLRKTFGGLVATDRVDFHIDEGNIVGLIGPNGAGKTTLFNLISGALVPTSGNIIYRGEDITGLKPYQICRRGIARTFQQVKLFSNMTVFENTQVGLTFGNPADLRGTEAGDLALDLLDFVGLGGMEKGPAKDLPVGSQKRLEVARALATGPKLLLLDEVMAGLNPTEVGEAIALIKRIRDRGITLFIVEHVMKAIMGLCDKIIVLHYGMKIAEGTPEVIAADKKVNEIYLGT